MLYCAGVERLIITAGNLEEARKALALARTHGGWAKGDPAARLMVVQGYGRGGGAEQATRGCAPE